MILNVLIASLLTHLPLVVDVNAEIKRAVGLSSCENADEISTLYKDALKSKAAVMPVETHRLVATHLAFCYSIVYERSKMRGTSAGSALKVSFLAESSASSATVSPPSPIEIVRSLNTLFSLTAVLQRNEPLTWSKMTPSQQQAVGMMLGVFVRARLVMFASLFGMDGRIRSEQETKDPEQARNNEILREQIKDFELGWEQVLPAPKPANKK